MKTKYIQYYIWVMFMFVCPIAVANGIQYAQPSLSGNAAEPSSDDHDFGYTKQPDMSTAETAPVIGSNGTFDVSQTGAAVYSYAIALPPGVGGMQPNVSVAYNSQGGNGIVGWGCNISGMSVITRGQKTVFHDGAAKGVTYANDDAYYLDGVRLMLISGSAGCDGAVYSPENAPSTKVIFHDGGLLTTWIEVKTADGKTYIYGDTSDSKQFCFKGIERGIVNAWYITKVEDRHGNYIGYSYMSDSCMVYPKEIFYGGNTRKDTKIYNSVKFEYESRSDRQEYLVSFHNVVMALRLRSIETATNGNRYRYYSLQYKSEDQSGKSFSRLYSITEQNADGEERPPVVLNWKSLPAFSQQVLSPDISLVKSYNRNTGISTEEQKVENEVFMAGDMTGDGLADIIEIASVSTKSTSQGWTTETFDTPLVVYRAEYLNGALRYVRHRSVSLGLNGKFPSKLFKFECHKLSSYQFDFDGDGLVDICVPQISEGEGADGRQVVFNLVRGGNFSHDRFAHILKGDDKYPYFTNADVDHDGRSEVIVLEKSPYGGGYICGLFGYKDESSIRHHEQILKLSYPPVHIFTGDFNNDGLVDLMVIETIRYKIYFNNGGKFEDGNMFSESNTRIGATLFGGDRVFQGDFNGDGLVDFLTNDSGYKNWYFCLNKGNGDFTKRLACTSDIYKHSDEKDGNKMQCLVFDFDFDGKSDVVMTNYVSESVPSKTVWMRSTGESLHTVKEVVSSSEANSLASRFAVGCFTGSGQIEMMNYGANCYSQDGQTEPQIHIYTNDGYTPESGKVTSVTDETGRTVDITYASLTDGNTYAMGYGTSYPVIGSTLPLHVVSGIKTDNGIAGDTELKYGYRGMRTHVAGRGFLGFTSVTATNSVTGDKTETTIDSWDTSCFAPAKTTVRKTSGGYTETTTVTNTYSVSAGKTFALQKATATTVNSDGISTTVRKTYDPQRGCLLSERKEGEFSENYHEAIYGDFIELAGMYLPQTVTYNDNYYDASNSVTRKTRITYDELGNKTSECINDGTSLPITNEYGYDVYGNVTSSTTYGEGVERMQSMNVYESSGRFVMKKYTVPASAALWYSYDQWGHPITEVDVTNPEDMLYTEYTYNSWGQAETVISPSCAHSKTVRGWGNDNSKRYYVLQFADGEPWVKTWYDSMGREVLVESVGMKDIDVSVKTEYDIYGRPIQVTSHTGDLCVTKTTAYDSSGHVASETSSNGGTVNYSYSGREINIDDNGRKYRKYYDDGGVLLSSTDMSGEIGYEYNSFYKPVKVRMLSDNSIVGIGYDDVGNRISLTDPDAGRTTYSHDALGRVRARTDARGHKTSYTFDAAGRQTRISGNDTVFAEYTYGTTGNGAQQLVKEESGDAYTTYSYDEYGWLSSKTRHIDGKNLVYRYTYNSLGQTTRIVYPGGVTADYTYDCYGNRTSIAVGGKTVWRMDGYTGKSYTSSFGSLLTEDVELDDCGRKTSYVLKKSGRLGSYTELYRTSYEYDKPTGNLTKKSIEREVISEAVTRPFEPVIDLGDFVGNTLSSDGMQPAHPRPDIPMETTWLGRTETYSYDSSDRLIQVDRNNSVYQ
ncbi:MAG: FG-GAP-like repeat-containing protein, partial [Prevotella sp.]|nr:FG-GAP-like repeat-containing protein [Prevotella sp.]